MRANIIYVVLAVIALVLVMGKNKAQDNKPLSQRLEQYDRSNPKHPMHGIYTDSNCSVEEQQKGIYNCP